MKTTTSARFFRIGLASIVSFGLGGIDTFASQTADSIESSNDVDIQIVERETLDDEKVDALKIVHASQADGLEQLKTLAFSSTRGTTWYFLPDSSMWVDATDFYNAEWEATSRYHTFLSRFGATRSVRYSVCTGDPQTIEKLHSGSTEYIVKPDDYDKQEELDFSTRYGYAASFLPFATDWYIRYKSAMQMPETDEGKSYIVSRFGILSYGFTKEGLRMIEGLDEDGMKEMFRFRLTTWLRVRFLHLNSQDIAPDFVNPNDPEAVERRRQAYPALSDELIEIAYQPF